MPFIQRNHKVQTLSSQRPEHPFADRIRHRRSHGCFDDVQPHMAHALVNVLGEDGISVMDEKTVRVISWDRFAELLDSPQRRRMRRHIDMKEPAARMLNNHKDIEDTKCHGDRHAEITCDDALGVIADKRGPSLRGGTLAWATDAVIRHVFAYCSWRDLQAKFE